MFLRAAGDGEDSTSPILLVVVSCIPIIRFMVCFLMILMSKYSTDEARHMMLKVLDEMGDTDEARKLREEVEDFFQKY